MPPPASPLSLKINKLKKKTGLFLLERRCSWTGQGGLRNQSLRSPGHVPPQNWSSCPTAGHSLSPSLGPKERAQHLCWGKQSLEGSARLCVSYRACLPSKVSQSYLCLFISGPAWSKISLWKREGNLLNAKFMPGTLYTVLQSIQLPLETGIMILLQIIWNHKGQAEDTEARRGWGAAQRQMVNSRVQIQIQTQVSLIPNSTLNYWNAFQAEVHTHAFMSSLQ